MHSLIVRNLILLLVSVLTVGQASADVVVVATSNGGQARRSGEIVEFTGEELRLAMPGGRESTIPTDQVIDVETTWHAQHEAGDRLLAAGKFAEALVQFDAAIQAEKRRWVQRRILAQTVRCAHHVGQIDLAGQRFLALVGNDSTTQYFDVIPLSWTAHRPNLALERQAEKWLASGTNPFAQLLGGSWLLSTGRRGAALTALRQLAANAEPRVALLAQGQLWRSEVVTAKAADVARWPEKIERLPPSLRSGPYYIYGRALAQLNQHERAALAMMRVPILYPSQRELSAAALLGAAIELEEIDQRREAVSLYRELIAKYAGLEQATEAQARINALEGK